MVEFVIRNPIFFDFSKIIIKDFYLAIISAIVGFFLLLLLLILRNTSFQIWIKRKSIHFIGGTYIGFIINFFDSLLGIILGIALFLAMFLILILTSKFKILKEYIILNECRENERNFAFLTNSIFTLVVLFSIMLIFSNYPAIFTASALIVSWADTSGEVIGRILPIYKYKIFNKKTLSGSIAVFITSFLTFLIILLHFNLSLPLYWIWRLILGSFVCAIVEAFSWKWIDNLLLPIFGSLFMLWFYLM
jgi:dolichol kinase